jgi:hypothetical protein
MTSPQDTIEFMLGKIDAKLDAIGSQGLTTLVRVEENARRITTLEQGKFYVIGATGFLGALLLYIGRNHIQAILMAL